VEALEEIKRQAADAIEKQNWWTFETEYPALPNKLWEPYLGRNHRFGLELYGALGTRREDRVGRLQQIKRNYQFFNAPVDLFITTDRGLGPGQWADLGGYIHTLAFLARGYGLDTCPQVAWIRMYKIVSALLKFSPEQMLFCGMGVGYGDRSHPVNSFRSSRVELDEFCKFYGFD